MNTRENRKDVLRQAIVEFMAEGQRGEPFGPKRTSYTIFRTMTELCTDEQMAQALADVIATGNSGAVPFMEAIAGYTFGYDIAVKADRLTK